MHLLVVEDERIVADQLKQLLQKERYGCDVSYTYKDALARIDAKKYDLILLDWNLPDGNGFTLLSDLRHDEINTPVLMLSANTTVDDRVKVLNAGGDDYLCKPYSNLELLARIRALLRRESPQKTALLQRGSVTLDPQVVMYMSMVLLLA